MELPALYCSKERSNRLSLALVQIILSNYRLNGQQSVAKKELRINKVADLFCHLTYPRDCAACRRGAYLSPLTNKAETVWYFTLLMFRLPPEGVVEVRPAPHRCAARQKRFHSLCDCTKLHHHAL